MQTWGRYTVFSCIERTLLTEVHDAYLQISADLVRRVNIRRPSAIDGAPRALVQHARQAVQLNHSRISPILELSYSGDVPLVVSEGLPGRALSTLITQSRGREIGLDVHAAMFVAIEILEGLSHAHQHADPVGRLLGLVHRDVRPETIWIGFDGAVRLGGFGFSADAQATRDPMPPLVDPLYWSPELARGQPVDHRSDIFSVGAVLFEMLTGHCVYDGHNAEERWASAQRAEVNMLAHAAPQLPADLARTIDAALAPDPQERPPSATVFRDELARLLFRGEPAYGTARLASAVAMVLGEAAADDQARATAAFQHLSHLEPGLVIRAPEPAPAPPSAAAPASLPQALKGPTTGTNPPMSDVGRRPPPPPPETTEDLAPTSESSWSDTEHFPALHGENSDSFDAFEARTQGMIADLEISEPALEPVVQSADHSPALPTPPRSHSPVPPSRSPVPPSRSPVPPSRSPVPPSRSPVPPPSPAARSSEPTAGASESDALAPAFTPPRIEEPDSSAALADAFAADSDLQSARGQSSRGLRWLWVAMLVAIVAGGGWLASSASHRRQAGEFARLAVVGRKAGGTLVVESIPAGARVLLNEDDTGQKTPMTMENLESEVTHTVTLQLDEQHSRTTTVSIQANRKRTLRVVFSEAVTTIRVETDPDEADIFVDGRSAGFSPSTLTLRTGVETKITVKKAGYVDKEWTLEPRPGIATTLSHAFELTDEMREAETERR